jgi:predicted amino acid racemase
VFLEVLRRRNPDFLRAAVALHREGRIPANSYVLDLDAIGANAATLAAEADRLGLKIYAMTKQQGRNPAAMATIGENGIEAGVAVDVDCARALVAGGMAVGHVGHLVQIAAGEAGEVAAMEPHHWTVFNETKAAEAGDAAAALGRSQRLLARIHAPGDRFYPGHEGGFEADDVLRVADALDARPGAEFAGLTTFPALIFDAEAREVRPTPNLGTLERAAERLRDAGREGIEINAPGTTSARTLGALADAGATQVEPGHALTGTTPWHAIEDLPELPAMLYLSEVSHLHDGRSYYFGGGLYVDPVFPPYQVRALVGSDADEVLANPVDTELPPPAAIDYYGQLDAAARPGDTVILGFRAQAFVTRAAVAAVSGVAGGEPRLTGIWGPDGRLREGSR